MITAVIFMAGLTLGDSSVTMKIEDVSEKRVFAGKYGNRVYETLILVGNDGKRVEVNLTAFHDRFGHYPQYSAGTKVNVPLTEENRVSWRRDQVRISD